MEVQNNHSDSNSLDIKLDPWNPNNKLITKKDIYAIFKCSGIHNCNDIIQINNIHLYQQAFVHGSYIENPEIKNTIVPRPKDILPLFKHDYEDLEFLGDRCLELSVAWYLYKKYPDSDPGFKTKLKIKIVKKDTLAYFARYLGFNKHLIISKYIEEKTINGRDNTRILEDVMEAFLCAIFLDQNMNTNIVQEPLQKRNIQSGGWVIVNMFIEHLIERCIDFEDLLRKEENFKELLLKLYQKEFKVTPKYLQLGVQGPPHNRVFTMGVLSKDGDIISRGSGKTKKEAEQEASRLALSYYDESFNEDSDNEIQL
jgi:ribonuclease III